VGDVCAAKGGQMGVLRLREAIRRRGRSVSAAGLAAEDSGQDLLEYALLVSLIVIAAIGAVEMLGSTLKTVFWDVISSAKF
jgi:Flp pilus assembly pilin Flp